MSRFTGIQNLSGRNGLSPLQRRAGKFSVFIRKFSTNNNDHQTEPIEYNVSGQFLYVMPPKCNARFFKIAFDHPSAEQLLVNSHDEFRIPFSRFYIYGFFRTEDTTFDDHLLFYVSDDPLASIVKQPVYETASIRSDLYDASADGTENANGMPTGIHVMSLGDVSYSSLEDGTTVTITNVPSGTFLPVRFSQILSATTADLLIPYER